MEKNNKKKTEFLGMNISTANMKLRKMIIFNLVQKCGLDNCFQCGDSIDHIDELSIEHKLPWLDKDVKLFWDLNNIAFSHLSCNVKASDRDRSHLRKDGPMGTSWCSGCKEFLPIDNFSPNSNKWNGKHWRCKKCKLR